MAFVLVVQSHSQVTSLEDFLGTEQQFREKRRRLLREKEVDVGLERLNCRG